MHNIKHSIMNLIMNLRAILWLHHHKYGFGINGSRPLFSHLLLPGIRSRFILYSLGNRKPLFAFYISCLGRVKKFLGTEKEESDEIRNVIGTKMPLIGIYSGVEIARIRDDVLPLDWTGVLCVFSKPLE